MIALTWMPRRVSMIQIPFSEKSGSGEQAESAGAVVLRQEAMRIVERVSMNDIHSCGISIVNHYDRCQGWHRLGVLISAGRSVHIC